MSKPYLGLFIFILLQAKASGLVRTITADDRTMLDINLSMGRSTVLHFYEKPAKVVVGNQNYFNIEFTGNDVTIQPLGSVTSNLFIYGEYHRYGFVLKVGGTDRYDDLVQVRWRASTLLSPLKPQILTQGEQKAIIPKVAQLVLKKVFHDRMRDLFVMELTIEDKSGVGLSTKDISFSISEGQKEILIKSVVFDRDGTTQGSPMLIARIFLAVPEKKTLALNARIKGKETKITLSPK